MEWYAARYFDRLWEISVLTCCFLIQLRQIEAPSQCTSCCTK
ncbi:hypothetical protein MtrunA17_Chr8g0336701 [Medicago truncatula]|uniref:Uncharacterized protein n=1 Tax=Medicago truncatula TaxID=3880 RepID=A0A396GD70_MEDTR|nr:hypothetical protein MtrunA17_Chr8g0336701 [Medicago truncatula]